MGWSQALGPDFTQRISICLTRVPGNIYQKGKEKEKKKGKRKKEGEVSSVKDINIREQVQISLVWDWVKRWFSQHHTFRMQFWSTLIWNFPLAWAGIFFWVCYLSPAKEQALCFTFPHFTQCVGLYVVESKNHPVRLEMGDILETILLTPISLQIWRLVSPETECLPHDHS